MSEDLRYPIGKFNTDFEISLEARQARIRTLKELPDKLAASVNGLDDGQLDTEYRPGGWTVRQTAHHVPDSHANALIRFKLALTEDESPTTRPYYEDRWAELADSRLPVSVSLAIIEGVHTRWAELLRNMSEADFAREFVHPETGNWTLEKALALYAWHSRHHTAHIAGTRERNSW